MARTAITISVAKNNYLKIGTPTIAPTPDNIDASNGNSIAVPVGGFDRVVLEVTNTFAGAKSVTVKAGAHSAAVNGADLVQSIPQSAVYYIPLTPSARFLQADGTIALTYDSGMTGTVRVFCLPVGV